LFSTNSYTEKKNKKQKQLCIINRISKAFVFEENNDDYKIKKKPEKKYKDKERINKRIRKIISRTRALIGIAEKKKKKHGTGDYIYEKRRD